MFQSLEIIIKESAERGIPFWKIVQEDDCRESNITAEESFERMIEHLKKMVPDEAALRKELKYNAVDKMPLYML